MSTARKDALTDAQQTGTLNKRKMKAILKEDPTEKPSISEKLLASSSGKDWACSDVSVWNGSSVRRLDTSTKAVRGSAQNDMQVNPFDLDAVTFEHIKRPCRPTEDATKRE